MRRLTIAIIFAVFGCHCHGQTTAAYEGCIEKLKTQSELNNCASDEAARADSELQAAYNGWLAKIAADSLAVAKLRVAEEAWLRYRDAYIAAVYPAQDKQLAYGTEYPMDVDLLRAKLTREHLAAITYLITELSTHAAVGIIVG
ncbi:MAG: DUF1311 domain-containing protein [Acidobacteria bacterium]|nr:DUF1311 domain-containing protein [Acidobacteriota bacterium]